MVVNAFMLCIKKKCKFSDPPGYPFPLEDIFYYSPSAIQHILLNSKTIVVSRKGKGDSGYALKPWMMVPFMNPAIPAEEVYNRKHRRTRVTIEQLFGIVKSRFRCIHKTGGYLCYAPVKCCKIIAAVFILHNICVDRNIPLIDNDVLPDEDHDLNPALNDVVLCGNGQQIRRNIATQFV